MFKHDIPQPVCSWRFKVSPPRHTLYGKIIAFRVPATVSLKNAFNFRLPQNMQAQKLKLHQFCEMQVQDCCRSAATAHWLLQLQTGYMLPLLGKLLQLATGYWLLATASGYCKRATCYCNYKLATATANRLLATGYCYSKWLMTPLPLLLLATGYSYCYLLLLLLLAGRLDKKTGMGDKVKASLARNGASKSITTKPTCLHVFTCLRCRMM